MKMNDLPDTFHRIADCSDAYYKPASFTDEDLDYTKRKANKYHRVAKTRVDAFLRNAENMCNEIQEEFDTKISNRTSYFLDSIENTFQNATASDYQLSPAQHKIYSDLVCFISSERKFDGNVDAEIDCFLDIMSRASQMTRNYNGSGYESYSEDPYGEHREGDDYPPF